MPDDFELRFGAIAFMDALGFAGIWKRENPSEVISKMQWLRDEAKRAFADAVSTLLVNSELRYQVRPGVELLSDTVVICSTPSHAWPQDVPDDTGFGAAYIELGAVIEAVRAFLSLSMQNQPYWTYRGCISYGQFIMQDNFVIGPAVDEAADLMETCEGAIVWLAPSARRISGETLRSILREHSVPLKEGKHFERYGLRNVPGEPRQHLTDALALGDLEMDERNWDELITRMLQTFVGGDDVQVKRQNTEAFLLQCKTGSLQIKEALRRTAHGTDGNAANR